MKKTLVPAFVMGLLFCLNSCTIETTKKSDGIKIEITTSDEIIINGEKISDKKLNREIKKLIKELEKEGLTREEIRKSIKEGKVSVEEAMEDLKKELEEIKSHAKHRDEQN